MNKKGFVFLETIIVLVIVVVSLSVVLTTFTTVVSKNKIRKYYNRTNDIYLLYNIFELTKIDGLSMLKSREDFFVNTNECNNIFGDYLEDCEKLFDDFNIESIGYTSNISSVLDEYKNYDNGMIEFLKQLKKREENNNIKYIYASFNIDNEYYYASVRVK